MFSKKSLIAEIIRFTSHSQIHSKRKELFQQNQAFLKQYFANSPVPVQTDSPTKPVPRTTKMLPTRVSDLSLHQVTVTDGPNVTIKTTHNMPSANVKSKSSMKIAEYDLNGDRDFLNFNITEYVDEKLNRIGSKEDGKILEKTLFKKGFKLRAFRDGQMGKQTIVDKLKQYVKDLKKDKRDVKVLIIAFMAHGGGEDVIVFSDKKTCRYKSLLKPIFECEQLRGVPKVIINQFCRGEFNMNTAYMDNVTNGNADRNRLINGQADLLQCFATVEGNVAVRQKDGSPFIKELCLLLKEWVSMTVLWITISARCFITFIAYSKKE